jgi:DHA2 family multidrug resistance protein-like MFS transporter
MAPETGPAIDGLPAPRRYWAMSALVLTMALCVLQVSLASVALPSIARYFKATTSQSIWVTNSFIITMLVAMLPLAAVGDRIGQRRLSQTGLVVFTAASLGCAFSQSLSALCIMRVLQGLGAAGMLSVYGGLIRFTYPLGMLGRAVGINSFVAGASAVAGPPLASAILAVGDWRWLFASVVPLGVFAFCVGARTLPTPSRERRPFDTVAIVLNVTTFGLLTIGIQSLAQEDGSGLAVLEIATGAVLAYLFARRELAQANPLLPLDLLRVPRFAVSILTSVLSFMAATAALIALPFEIERLGYSAAQVGLLMTPWSAALAVVAPIAGRLADRYSADSLGAVGLVLFGCGLCCLMFHAPQAGVPDFLWRGALCGVGFGLFQSPNLRLILSSAPIARSGAAGAMQNVARLLGQSLGATSVALLFRLFPVTGSNVTLGMAAVVALVAAVASATRLWFQAPSPQPNEATG